MLVRGFRTYGIIFLAYIAGLWAMSIPLTGDQKVYLSIALEMRERSEWLIPYLFGEPNFLKPPLEYWATLVGWKVFGFHLFGALLPSVLAMLASCYLVNRLFKSKNQLAGLLFAGCFGTMTYGTTAQMEIWIVLFYLAAWVDWREGRVARALIWVGMMAWIKGPLYPVLWVMSVGLEHLLERKKFDWRLLGPLAIGIAVGLSWYLLAAHAQWQAMKSVFFQKENLGKMNTSQGTPWGLWGEYFYSLFPWVPLWILALNSPRARSLWKQNQKFILVFGLIPALFFTFFPYRVYSYLYLLAPLFAWMASVMDPNPLERVERRVHLALVGFVGAVASVLGLITIRFTQGGWIGYELAGPIVLNLILWAFFFARTYWVGFAWTGLLLVSLFRLGAVQIGERDLTALRDDLATQPESHYAYWMQESDIWHEFGLVSAAIRQDVARLSTQELASFLNAGGALLLSEEQWSSDHVKALDVTCVSWPRLKRRLKFPFRRLLQEGLRADDPEIIRYFFICKARHSSEHS